MLLCNKGTVPYHAFDQSIRYEDYHVFLFARMAQLSPYKKHIAIPYHWFRMKIVSKPIDTKEQRANQFTSQLSMHCQISG
jgi:hypothetical protein